jgi:hypothetical protein
MSCQHVGRAFQSICKDKDNKMVGRKPNWMHEVRADLSVDRILFCEPERGLIFAQAFKQTNTH